MKTSDDNKWSRSSQRSARQADEQTTRRATVMWAMSINYLLGPTGRMGGIRLRIRTYPGSQMYRKT